MKRRQRLLAHVLCIVLLAGVTRSAGRAEGTLERDEYRTLQICEGIVRLFESHAADIWPGYDLSERPFLVYVPEKWALLFHGPQDIEGFEPYPAEWPDLATHVLYHQGKYRNLVGQLAFDVAVDSTVIFAVGLPDKFPESFDNPELMVFSYIVHEGFHQYQHDAFGDIPWAREERYPIQDVENSALAYLEMVLLIDALEAMQIGDGAACHELIKRFVAVRNHRWNHADPFVALYEQGQEINEGTAKYVELKSIDLMTGFRYNSNMEGVAEPLKNCFRSVSMPAYLIGLFQDRMKEGFVPTEDMLRNRIYPVASTQGFLLDYFRIDWKERAQTAGPDFTYAALFDEYLGTEESRSESLLDETKRTYDFDHILTATTQSVEGYLRSYRQALAAFHDQAGHKIEVDFCYTGISRSRVSKERKWIVNQGTWTLCNHFAVYTLENSDLTLQLHNRGVLERNDWDAKRKTVVFYTAAPDTVRLDGNAISLQEDIQRTFEEIELLGEGLYFSSHQAGTLVSLRGDIKIALVP